MKKPIFNYRTIVGYASNAEQAKRVIKKQLQAIPDNFDVIVEERSELMREMLNSPLGYVYSIKMV